MFVAGSASADQVISALALLAQSESYTLEVKAVQSEMSSPLRLSLDNVAGADQETLTIDDSTLAEIVPTEYALVVTDYKEQRPGVMPAFMVWSAPGRIWMDGSDPYRNPGYQGMVHKIRVASFAEHDRPERARQAALAMATAFSRLVRRNPELGGLVFKIEADGPPEVVTAMDKGAVAAAGCEYDAYVVFPDVQ